MSNDDMAGAAILAIPAVCLLILCARFGGPVTTGVAALAVVPVAALAVLLLRARPRLASGRAVAVRGHGHGAGARLRATIATHEAGHAVAARALGGRVCSATMHDSGGLVQAILPDDSAQSALTFLLAGQRAAGTSEGSSADNAAIRAELRTLPSGDRAQVRRDADRAAKRIVSSRAGEIRSTAARLNERGHL